MRALLTVPDLLSRRHELNRSVHVINVEIKDNHEEAKKASSAFLALAEAIEQARDIDEDIDAILERQQEQFAYPLLHRARYSTCMAKYAFVRL